MYFPPKQYQCGFISTSRLFGAKFRVSFAAPCGARELHRDLTPFPTAASLTVTQIAFRSCVAAAVAVSTQQIHNRSKYYLCDIDHTKEGQHVRQGEKQRICSHQSQRTGYFPLIKSAAHTHTNASEPANTRVLIIKSANLVKSLS